MGRDAATSREFRQKGCETAMHHSLTHASALLLQALLLRPKTRHSALALARARTHYESFTLLPAESLQITTLFHGRRGFSNFNNARLY